MEKIKTTCDDSKARTVRKSTKARVGTDAFVRPVERSETIHFLHRPTTYNKIVNTTLTNTDVASGK